MVSLFAFGPISAVSCSSTTAEPAVVLQQPRPKGTDRERQDGTGQDETGRDAVRSAVPEVPAGRAPRRRAAIRSPPRGPESKELLARLCLQAERALGKGTTRG